MKKINITQIYKNFTNEWNGEFTKITQTFQYVFLKIQVEYVTEYVHILLVIISFLSRNKPGRYQNVF